ncbi:hypothetical protein TNCV_179501 [Trichonephila clavipes]|nr:hypothetical protein TNCV_179501 [Trichonephila clavipes]
MRRVENRAWNLFPKRPHKHSMIFSSDDWGYHIRDVLLHHDAHITFFEHSETCEQGIVLLEHGAISQEQVLKHRVKMICKNVSLIVACHHPPQDNEMHQFTERYCTHTITVCFHGWNHAVNMKCFFRCSTDEHMSGGLE